MQCLKVRWILWYHVLNKILSPEKFAHHVLFLFYTFRDEKELLSGFPPLHQNKLQEQWGQDVVNTNKIKFESYGDLADQAYSKFNEILVNNQDPQSQIENDETPGAEYSNESCSENRETNKATSTANFMSKILPDNDIAEGKNSLNSKQRDVFNVVHTWARDYVKYNGHNVEPVHIFLSGSKTTGKSHLVKVIYNAISKTLLYHSKDPEKPRGLMLGPTGISVVNVPPFILVLELNQEQSYLV